MANEEYNTLEDLVFSRSFRNWVLNEAGPEADFWTNWVAGNTHKTETIIQARAVIHALQLNLPQLPDGTADADIRKVLQKMREGRPNLVREIPFRPGLLRHRHARTWTIAAIVAFLAIAIWATRFYLGQHHLHDLHDKSNHTPQGRSSSSGKE